MLLYLCGFATALLIAAGVAFRFRAWVRRRIGAIEERSLEPFIIEPRERITEQERANLISQWEDVHRRTGRTAIISEGVNLMVPIGGVGEQYGLYQRPDGEGRHWYCDGVHQEVNRDTGGQHLTRRVSLVRLERILWEPEMDPSQVAPPARTPPES